MESLAADLRTMVRTPLEPEHVRAMRKVGETISVKAGEMLVPLGAPTDAFFYLEEGEVEAIDPISGERYGGGTLGPTQFFGEICFLAGGDALLGARAVTDSSVLRVDREEMLRLMSQIPEMSDIIVTVFAARRRRMLEAPDAGITLLATDGDREMRTIAAFASRNRIPYRESDQNSDEAHRLAQACGVAPDTPAVSFGMT